MRQLHEWELKYASHAIQRDVIWNGLIDPAKWTDPAKWIDRKLVKNLSSSCLPGEGPPEALKKASQTPLNSVHHG